MSARSLETRQRPVAQLRALEDGKSEDSKGRFEAVVSVFGNVDSYGERMIFGAFEKSLAERGFPPIIWTHRWETVPIGVTEEAEEAKGIKLLDGREVDGLRILYRLFVDDNATAREVDTAQRAMGGDGKPALREYSFAFFVKSELNIWDDEDEFEPVDATHVADLLEVDIIEAGPTLIGANPETGPVALLSRLSRRRDGKSAKAARAILEAGDAIVGLKAGAVLSQANRARIENAIDALGEVLADADKDQETDTSGGKSTTEERRREVAELLATF